MEAALKSELKQEIQRIVDFMIQIEAMRDKISALKNYNWLFFGIYVFRYNRNVHPSKLIFLSI